MLCWSEMTKQFLKWYLLKKESSLTKVISISDKMNYLEPGLLILL